MNAALNSPQVPSVGPETGPDLEPKPPENWIDAATQSLNLAGQVASEVGEAVADELSRATRRAEYRLNRAYEQGSKRIGEWAEKADNRLHDVIENKPLELVGYVAGVAFLAGLIIRIARSSRHE